MAACAPATSCVAPLTVEGARKRFASATVTASLRFAAGGHIVGRATISPAPPEASAGFLRLRLAGRVEVKGPTGTAGEDVLGGRQGRLVLAVLVDRLGQPVAKHVLADAVWGDGPPRTWDPALRTIVSKVRGGLHAAGADPTLLRASFGCYALRLPPGTTVDLDEARHAVDRAERALASGRPREAIASAEAALTVLTLPILEGEDGAWVQQLRVDLAARRVRALQALAAAQLAMGNHSAALAAAETLVTVEPLRESAHRLVMAAHARAGNLGEALAAYDRCRRILANEVGAPPSPETVAAYRELLGAGERRAAEPGPGQLRVRPPAPSPPLSAEGCSGCENTSAEAGDGATTAEAQPPGGWCITS
ncbi:MAG TPA: bacterial transcriptional activator domain-containing protein [Mycobacteriales bacterium]|nr:bacterial transcriptional activator domain-containing protein [Mycobacteriales bacterium]